MKVIAIYKNTVQAQQDLYFLTGRGVAAVVYSGMAPGAFDAEYRKPVALAVQNLNTTRASELLKERYRKASIDGNIGKLRLVSTDDNSSDYDWLSTR